ncbi:MAG: hypothetical protein WCK98_04170 [bacterium]
MSTQKAQKQSRLKNFKQKLKYFLDKPTGKVATFVLALVLILGLIFTGINQIQKNTARAGINCDVANGFIVNGLQCTKRSALVNTYQCFDGSQSSTSCSYGIVQFENSALNATTTILGLPLLIHNMSTPAATTIVCPANYTIGSYLYSNVSNNIYNIMCIQNDNLEVSSQNITSAATTSSKMFYINQNLSSVLACPNNYTEITRRPTTLDPFSGVTPYILCASNVFVTVYSFAPLSGVTNPTKPLLYSTGSFNNGTYCPSGYQAMTEDQARDLTAMISKIMCALSSPATKTILICPVGGYINTNDGTSTPCQLTVNSSSFTPTNGQITNLTCTPTNPPAGSSVSCSGQATGNPNYPTIPYFGDVTVSIDNGGGNATASLTANGSFTTTGITVGTVPGTTPVTKTATTNLGGSTTINVTSTVPSLCSSTCTSGTNMNGSITGTISSAVSGTITFPQATNIPTSTPGVFTGAGTACTINGAFTTVISGGVVFTPTGNVPAGCTTGAQTGSLTTTGLSTNPTTSGVPSNFTGNPLTDTLFIDPSKLTFSPIESAAVKFGLADLTLTVGGGNAGALNDPRFTANNTTARCVFRLKEYGVLDSDTSSKGFDLSTAKLAGSVADLDLTNKTFDVAYSTTTGCSVKLPLGAAQNQPKWWFEVRVVRSDGQVFGQNMSYFQTYGAIGGVAVS